MDLTLEVTTRIRYSIRTGYYHDAKKAAEEGLQRFPDEISLKFYRAVALLLIRKINDALRELEPLQSQRPVSIGACLASIYAHKACVQVDREAVVSLESKVKESRKTAPPEVLYCGGVMEKSKSLVWLYLRRLTSLVCMQNRLNDVEFKNSAWRTLKVHIQLQEFLLASLYLMKPSQTFSLATFLTSELCYAGLFLSLTGRHDKAREYLDRVIKQGHNADALCARGWAAILSQEKSSKTAAEYFESVLKDNRKHLDAILGLAQYYEVSHRFEASIEKLNFALAILPNWIPALVEKMKVVIAVPDWEQAQDIGNRILGIEDNLEARRIKILYVLCREGNLDVAIPMIQDFLLICKGMEPCNAKYFIENARLFSQLASFSHGILGECMKFAKFASELEIDNAEYIADIGKLHLLMSNTKEAHQEFRMATEMDKTSISALFGLISCQLTEGNVDHASQQLEFLRELASSIDKPPELQYLSAIVAKEKHQASELIVKYLNDALDAHFAKMKGLAFNLKYLKLINPDLVLKIVREYLHFAPQEPVGPGMPLPIAVKQASMILETVKKICPCHRDALFIGAQIQYISGDTRSAIATLEQLSRIDSTLMDAHLLLAQVYIAQNEFDSASSTLDNGLSSNFKIREHPKYQLMLAKVQRYRGDLKSAVKTLDSAVSLLRNKKGILDESPRDQSPLNPSDKMSMYMELISVHRELGNTEEANELMQEAMLEFKGTKMEGLLGLKHAEEMICKGEFDKALAQLRTVQPDQPHFIESRRLMSEIYLNYRINNEMYIACFTEIVNSNPIPANLVMLADAYMTIQEPDKAVEIYEVALAKNPRDPLLASKMGQALVLTHQYNKAINYYKEAVKTDDNFSLRYDLATLHMKLKQWDKAEKTIQQALSESKDSSLATLMMEVKFLILLAKVLQGAGNSSLAQQSLVRAKDSQSRVLKRISFEQPSNLAEQQAQFCTICKLLGDVADKLSEIEFAIRSLKEALEVCPDDWQCLTVLAKLYMRAGDTIHCQQTCQQLLKVKEDCPDASLMLGELFFRKADFQSSSFHFQQFLDRNPVNWKSLMWFIECGRRMGNLSEAETYLKAAGNITDQNDPGFGYCQGIFEWYNGNSNGALKWLNKARKDSAYGSKALTAMIDIYINPTGNVLGGEALESSGGGDSLANGNANKSDYREVTLNTAESLIMELNAKNQEEKFRRHILECFVLIASKNKNKIERAIQELTGLLTTEFGRESVILVYALATGYMYIKQTPKARNQLKRISKSAWIVEDAEYLERCWLLLSDLYIQSSKYDLATELIKKVLQYNKSCYKANEYLGYIMEKEQAYADAASNYESAWKLTNCSNPVMGYKLAFNYLKAKRYCDAIDVCHAVIGKYPNYPKIKKEILDKARANLKP